MGRLRAIKDTYSSLVNTGLAMMPGDISKLVLRTGSMSRNRYRLRNEVRKRGLAVLDRNSPSVGGEILNTL